MEQAAIIIQRYWRKNGFARRLSYLARELKSIVDNIPLHMSENKILEYLKFRNYYSILDTIYKMLDDLKKKRKCSNSKSLLSFSNANIIWKIMKMESCRTNPTIGIFVCTWMEVLQMVQNTQLEIPMSLLEEICIQMQNLDNELNKKDGVHDTILYQEYVFKLYKLYHEKEFILKSLYQYGLTEKNRQICIAQGVLEMSCEEKVWKECVDMEPKED